MNIIIFSGLIKMALVLVLVSATLLITRRDLISLFRTYSFQSFLIASVALLLFVQERNEILLFTAIITLVSKGFMIPYILKRVQSSMKIKRDVEFHYLQPSSSIFVSIMMIILVNILLSKLFMGLGFPKLLFIGAVLGISLMLMGMLIIFSRRQIITKIIGYLTMENGVVLFSLFLSELPLIIEMFVLMDLIMLVMIAAILAFGIDSSIEEFHSKLNLFGKWLKGVTKQ